MSSAKARKKAPPRVGQVAALRAPPKAARPALRNPPTVATPTDKPPNQPEGVQGSLLPEGFAVETSDAFMRERQIDLTPLPVVEQFVEHHLHTTGSDRYQKVLDCCAGYGAFGLALKRKRPEIKRWGAEPAKLDGWERHYDETVPLDFAKLVDDLRGTGILFDAIVTNPAFRIWRLIHEHAQGLLSPGGRLILLGTNSWGQRSEDGLECFERWAPLRQHRIPGTIKFRNGLNPKTHKPYTADVRSYCWWEFQEGHTSDGWRSHNLPRLRPAQRQWRVPPGSETA